jgi:hypothetical protein
MDKIDTMQNIDIILDAFTPLEAIAMLNSCISTQAERLEAMQEAHQASLEALTASLKGCLDV